jgi:hypothetical protein
MSTFSLLPSTCREVDVPRNPELVARKKTRNTPLERIVLFPNHYDFNTNTIYSWTPGSVCNANTAALPVLTGLGMTLAMLNVFSQAATWGFNLMMNLRCLYLPKDGIHCSRSVSQGHNNPTTTLSAAYARSTMRHNDQVAEMVLALAGFCSKFRRL